MSDPIDIDPTKPEEQGAAGGGDDDAQDLNLPGGPTEAPDEQRRPKYPYERVPQHDKDDIPMSTKLPDEKKRIAFHFKGH